MSKIISRESRDVIPDKIIVERIKVCRKLLE